MHAFWDTLIEPKDTRLLLEFMGLANHRKEIRTEIAAWSDRWREQQITALNFIIREHDIDPDEFSPAAIAVVIASIGRTLILEAGTRFLRRPRGGRRAGQPLPGPIRDAGAEDPPGQLTAAQGNTTRSRSQPRTVEVDANCAVS